MYCKCKSPKKKVSEANGNSFVVCAKSQGGCGEEISQSFIAPPTQQEVTKAQIDSMALNIQLCEECEGDTYYGGFASIVCKRCDGKGYN